MKRVIMFLSFLVATVTLPVAAGDLNWPVLLWWVKDVSPAEDFADPNVKTVADLVSRPDGRSVNDNGTPSVSVRIRTSKADDGGAPVYLNMIEGDAGNYSIGNSLSYWSYDDFMEQGEAGPVWADLTGYGKGDSFTMELGYGTEEQWFVMAVSDTTTYEELAEFINVNPVDIPGYVPWTPAFHVPEPSSGLLVFIGGGLLALRRRKFPQGVNA